MARLYSEKENIDQILEILRPIHSKLKEINNFLRTAHNQEDYNGNYHGFKSKELDRVAVRARDSVEGFCGQEAEAEVTR